MPNGYVLNNAQYVCVFFYSVNMQKNGYLVDQKL